MVISLLLACLLPRLGFSGPPIGAVPAVDPCERNYTGLGPVTLDPRIHRMGRMQLELRDQTVPIRWAMRSIPGPRGPDATTHVDLWLPGMGQSLENLIGLEDRVLRPGQHYFYELLGMGENMPVIQRTIHYTEQIQLIIQAIRALPSRRVRINSISYSGWVMQLALNDPEFIRFVNEELDFFEVVLNVPGTEPMDNAGIISYSQGERMALQATEAVGSMFRNQLDIASVFLPRWAQPFLIEPLIQATNFTTDAQGRMVRFPGNQMASGAMRAAQYSDPLAGGMGRQFAGIREHWGYEAVYDSPIVVSDKIKVIIIFPHQDLIPVESTLRIIRAFITNQHWTAGEVPNLDVFMLVSPNSVMSPLRHDLYEPSNAGVVSTALGVPTAPPGLNLYIIDRDGRVIEVPTFPAFIRAAKALNPLSALN